MAIRLEDLSHVIGLIHQAGAAPNAWPDALAGVLKVTDGSRICLMDISSLSGELKSIAQIGHDPVKARLYTEYYYSIDPTREACLNAPVFEVTTVHETFTQSVRSRHEYFDYARGCDIGDVIGFGTAAVQGIRSILSMQRAVDAPAYGSDEKRLFRLLAPHVQAAKRVEVALGQAWTAAQELEAGFGRLTVPAFIVDRRGQIRHANAAATALLKERHALTSRFGKLVLDGKLAAAFQSALIQATQDRPQCSALALRLGTHPAELLVTPLGPQHPATSPWQVPLALVILARPERNARAIAWRMLRLYGLTPAEARLAAALALGQSLADIAHVQHVSLATVRTQLRSVFSKTGTSRQAQLVRLALAGAGVVLDQ